MPETLEAPSTAGSPPTPVAPAAATAPAAPVSRVPTLANQPQRPAREGLFKKLDAKAAEEFQESSAGRRAARSAESAAKPAEAKADEGTPPADKPAEPAAKPAEAAAKPDDAPIDKPAEYPDEEAAGKMRAGELSRHYKAVLKENKALKAQRVTMEADRAKGALADPEKVKLTETLAERDKRLNELSDIIRYKAFEESPDYKNEYEAPYLEAFTEARTKVAGLRVRELVNSETQEVTQAARKGTADDFDRLFSMPDDSDAGDLAEKLFGPNAATVMIHREEVLKMNRKRLNALEKYRKEGSEIEKQRGEKFTQLRQQITKDAGEMWQRHTKAVMEDAKLAPLFRPIEGDQEANDLLDAGFKEVEAAFKVMDPLDPRMSPEQREKIVAAHARVFNKAAIADRLLYLLSKEKKALKTAQDRLKAFEDSAPGAGAGAGQRGARAVPPPNGRDRIYQALEKRAVPIR